MKKDDDRYDFQIVHHFIDLNELTLKKIPVCFIRNCYKSNYLIVPFNMKAEISEPEEQGWFRRPSQSIEMEQPEEGKDWNTYFQYEAHKNLLKELPEDEQHNI